MFSHPKIIAAAMPAYSNYQWTVLQIEWVLLTIPKNGANLGATSDSTIVPTSLGYDVELAGYPTLAKKFKVNGDCEVLLISSCLRARTLVHRLNT